MNRRIAAYVHNFNIHQDYFECHECGEELWFERSKPYVLKGLIQAAVCLYHLRRGNLRGATAMWARSKSYIQQYMAEGNAAYEGIDLARLIANIDVVFRAVALAGSVGYVEPGRRWGRSLSEVAVRVKLKRVRRRLMAR